MCYKKIILNRNGIDNLYKKITIFVLLFLVLFTITSCKKDKDEEPSDSQSYDIYVENYFNWDKCYVINPHFNIQLILHDSNYFYGEIPVDSALNDNFEIIISNGEYQLPQTTFNKDFPYYCNGKWYENRIDYSKIVYYSNNNDFTIPILCYELNGKVIEQQMHINGDNIYYGYISKDVNTYYYKEYNGSNFTSVLTYHSNNNYYVHGNLEEYSKNNNIDTPSTNNIYMQLPSDWSECYYYVWGSEGEKTRWPGEPCQKLTDSVYYFEKIEKYPNFIFNCGPNNHGISRTQTPDLNESQISIFSNPMYNLETESFSELTNDLSSICTKRTIFANRPLNFVNTYLCYTFDKETISIKLEKVIDNIFGITCYIPSVVNSVYFSNGKGLRTLDLDLNEEYNYYNSKGEWLYLDNYSAPGSDILPDLPELPNNPTIPSLPTFPDLSIPSPDKDEIDIYNELFDINNRVAVYIDISEKELLKIEKDYEEFSSRGSKSPIYRMCDLVITINNDQYYINEVGIRMKGNTSRTSFYDEINGIYNYIHYKLKFTETFDDEDDYDETEIKVWEDNSLRKERKNRTFATLEGLELKWNKNMDGTHLRTYFAYDLFEKNNYLSPNCTVSQVLITEFDTLQNLGIFELNEPVDEIFLSKHLEEKDLGGDLYKVGWDNKNGGKLTTDTLYGIGVEDEHAGYFPIYDLKTNKKTSSNENLINLINLLNSNITSVESVVDIDMFLKFAALSYLTGNPDDYRNNYNNYYMYFLKSSNKVIFIPYDLDRTYGITKDWDPFENGSSRIDPLTNSSVLGEQVNPLIRYTICYNSNSKYLNKYINYLKEYSDNEYFNINYINSIYNIAYNNYNSLYKPTINELVKKSINFSMYDNNFNIGEFIKNIKENVNQINY